MCSACRPAALLRFSVMLRLFRFMFRNPMLSLPFILNPIAPRVWSPVPGGSILITFAPMSARSMVQNGPAMTWLTSSTRKWDNGREEAAPGAGDGCMGSGVERPTPDPRTAPPVPKRTRTRF